MRLRSHHIQPRYVLAISVAVGLVSFGIPPMAAHASPSTCAEIIATWDPSESVSIATADELYCIGENINTLDMDFSLTTNIDISALAVDTTWRPIGLGVGAFTGSLDGNGKGIANLVINAAGTADSDDGEQKMGLISETSNASITNLTLISPVVHAGSLSGALVGHSSNSTISHITATDVYVTGDLAGEIKVGGVVGYAVNSTMTMISATGTVEADGPGYEVGGIIGRVDGGPSGELTAPAMTVSDVDFSGTVRANTSAGGVLGAGDAPPTDETKWISISNASSAGSVLTIDPFDSATRWNNSIGGVIGAIYDSELSDIHSSATVTASATDVGGLIGWASDIRLTDASATGAVTNEVSGDTIWCDTGGLIGALNRYDRSGDQPNVPVSNVHATGDVSCEGGHATGGLIGYIADVDISNSYAAGNVSGIGPDSHGVGGFAGYVYDSTFIDVSASGDVTAAGDYVAGLIAGAYRSDPTWSNRPSDVVITRAQSSGAVHGRAFVGGLVADGEVYTSSGAIQILSSIATGTVRGQQDVGGVAGGGGGDFVLRDTASTGGITGWVTADDTPPTADLGFYGGLVGFLSSTGSIERSYTTSTITTDIETYGGDGGSIPAYDPTDPTVGSMIGVSEGAMSGLSFTATDPNTLPVAGQLPVGEATKAAYRSLSQLGQLSTYESWNTPDTVIVAGWVPSPRTTQVWGSCTDVASGIPFLQWQRTSACVAAPTPSPTPSPSGGGSGSGETASQPTTAPSTPQSPSNGSFTPVVSTGFQPAFRQPTAAQPVTGTVTLVPAAVAAATPTRAMRQEASATLGSAPTVTATANQPVKLMVPGFTPGGTYTVQVKSNNGYVVLGSVEADANGQLQMPVFRMTGGASTTTIAIVSATGEASYVKVKTTNKRGAGDRNRTRGAQASSRR